MSRDFGNLGHLKWGEWAPSEDTSLTPLEIGKGKPWEKKKRKQEAKAVWSPEEPGQEEMVMVTATLVISARSGFTV